VRLCLVIIMLFFSSTSQARDLCEEYANWMPLPKWYPASCDPSGRMRSSLGGAYSTFADAFNLNPAAIITKFTPYGAEYIYSKTETGSNSNFALLKGYGKAGVALTTSSDETFYGNGLFYKFADARGKQISAVPALGTFPTVNLGTAVDLIKMFADGKLNTSILPTIGTMIKFNKATNSFQYGIGAGLQIWKMSLGYSRNQDPETKYTPLTRSETVTLGIKVARIRIEGVIVFVNQIAETVTGTLVQPSSSKFLTVSGNLSRLSITAAYRNFYNSLNQQTNGYHFSLNLSVTPQMSVQYLHNYVETGRSLGIQYIF
jgi:hypothetical protein